MAAVKRSRFHCWLRLIDFVVEIAVFATGSVLFAVFEFQVDVDQVHFPIEHLVSSTSVAASEIVTPLYFWKCIDHLLRGGADVRVYPLSR